ncbi:MAG TPA: hypothetical protein VFI61_02660 [Patescibacteria group bacterium]|nr:hypothetical protein [Patescibacteria group bacterium]
MAQDINEGKYKDPGIQEDKMMSLAKAVTIIVGFLIIAIIVGLAIAGNGF